MYPIRCNVKLMRLGGHRTTGRYYYQISFTVLKQHEDDRSQNFNSERILIHHCHETNWRIVSDLVPTLCFDTRQIYVRGATRDQDTDTHSIYPPTFSTADSVYRDVVATLKDYNDFCSQNMSSPNRGRSRFEMLEVL